MSLLFLLSILFTSCRNSGEPHTKKQQKRSLPDEIQVINTEKTPAVPAYIKEAYSVERGYSKVGRKQITLDKPVQSLAGGYHQITEAINAGTLDATPSYDPEEGEEPELRFAAKDGEWFLYSVHSMEGKTDKGQFVTQIIAGLGIKRGSRKVYYFSFW